MTTIKNLNDALVEELKDLYSAENQLVKALPKIENKVSNQRLKESFRTHLEETKGQLGRLDQIASLLDVKLTGKVCKAMQGLIEEGQEVMELKNVNEAIIDALLIGAAQRVEHYEMAVYGTARAMAEMLDEDEIADLLQESLDEESKADETLSVISETEILPQACQPEERFDNGKRGNLGKALVLVLTSLLMLSPTSYAEDTESKVIEHEHAAQKHKVDNTGRNARDLNDNRKTADDQSLTGNQNEVAASIRRELMSNDSLSTYGKNVKIVVDQGLVTLRGPVKSMEEKKIIEDAALKVAPNHKLDSDLEVTSS